MRSKNSSRTTKRRRVLAGSVCGLLAVACITVGKLGIAYLNSPEKSQDKPAEAVTFGGPATIDLSDRRSDDHSDDHSKDDHSIFVDQSRDDHSDRRVTAQIDQSVHNGATVVPPQVAPAPQGGPPRQQVAPQGAPNRARESQPQAVQPPQARSYEAATVGEEAALLGALEDLEERGLAAAEQCSTLSDCKARYNDWYDKSLAALQKLDDYIRRQYSRGEHFEGHFKLESPMSDLSGLPAAEQFDLFRRSFHAYAGMLGACVSRTKVMRLSASAH